MKKNTPENKLARGIIDKAQGQATNASCGPYRGSADIGVDVKQDRWPKY